MRLIAVAKTLGTRALQKRLAAQGADVVSSAPAQFRAFAIRKLRKCALVAKA